MRSRGCSSRTDRLSSLPDDILDHILSFVRDTEERARTSLLSKRFRHLWRHHPSIRLGSTPDLISLSDRDPGYAAAISRYQRSVDVCLSPSSFRSPTLRTLDLRLFSRLPNCSRSASRWISFAASRSVHSLRLWSLDRQRLPRALFSCQALTSLHLDCFTRRLPGINASACFPSLLDLYLSCPFSDETLTLFLSKCPALRTLTLYLCCYLVVLRLSSKTLSALKIDSCDGLKSVWIDSPNLVSITFCGKVDVLRVNNARHLVDASICKGTYYCRRLTAPLEVSALIQDLQLLSRRLTVTDWLFDALLSKSPNHPVFGNLKELCCQIDCLTARRLSSLIFILGCCPNLEELHINLCFGKRFYLFGRDRINRDFDMAEEKSEQSLKHLTDMDRLIKKLIKELKDDRRRKVWNQSKAMEGLEDARRSLKFIKLEHFLGTVNEIKMIEYLLGTESALEKLIIDDSLLREEWEILDLLAHISIASPHVQIYCSY